MRHDGSVVGRLEQRIADGDDHDGGEVAGDADRGDRLGAAKTGQRARECGRIERAIDGGQRHNADPRGRDHARSAALRARHEVLVVAIEVAVRGDRF